MVSTFVGRDSEPSPCSLSHKLNVGENLGAVSLGHDNALVYGKLLGLDGAELARLERDEVV